MKSKVYVKWVTNNGKHNWLLETKLEIWYFSALPITTPPIERYIKYKGFFQSGEICEENKKWLLDSCRSRLWSGAWLPRVERQRKVTLHVSWIWYSLTNLQDYERSEEKLRKIGALRYPCARLMVIEKWIKNDTLKTSMEWMWNTLMPDPWR